MPVETGANFAGGDISRLFVAPVAAFERARGLQDGSTVLDARFAFDWMLIDEVQDPTLVEQWLLVDVAARSGRMRGVIPGMVVAGDEAQTVRPTAFEFGPLSTMIERRLGGRSERGRHELGQNLRSPQSVADLVDRADNVLYGLLPRGERPRGRRVDRRTGAEDHPSRRVRSPVRVESIEPSVRSSICAA